MPGGYARYTDRLAQWAGSMDGKPDRQAGDILRVRSVESMRLDEEERARRDAEDAQRRQAKEDADRATALANLQRICQQRFGIEPERFYLDPETNHVGSHPLICQLGDMWLLATPGCRWTELGASGEAVDFQLLGECAKCHMPCWSRSFSTKIGLGIQIVTFEASGEHRCPEPDPEPEPENLFKSELEHLEPVPAPEPEPPYLSGYKAVTIFAGDDKAANAILADPDVDLIASPVWTDGDGASWMTIIVYKTPRPTETE